MSQCQDSNPLLLAHEECALTLGCSHLPDLMSLYYSALNLILFGFQTPRQGKMCAIRTRQPRPAIDVTANCFFSNQSAAVTSSEIINQLEKALSRSVERQKYLLQLLLVNVFSWDHRNSLIYSCLIMISIL